jgi:fatty-acid desaturase
MNLTHNDKVRGLQVINHIASIVGISLAFYFQEWYLFLVALLVYWAIGILGINVGYHRLLSHRSFKTRLWTEKLLSVIGILTTVGSPLAWVAIHRQHHRRAEHPGDPHSPYLIGNLRAWFGIWPKIRLDLKLIRDLREQEFQRWLHKNYFVIIFAYVAILACINPWLVVFAYCLPACLCLHSSSAIIVIAHRHGYVTHKVNDHSRNSWIANLITMGEGWHNNHHAKPYAWSNWEKWWEWDIPALIIRVIKK